MFVLPSTPNTGVLITSPDLPVNSEHGTIQRPFEGLGTIQGPFWSVFVLPESVGGNDARMFQPSRDLRLLEKPKPAGGVVGMAWQNLFEGDFAIELFIERY